MAPAYETVELSVEAGLATVTLNRPQALNALDVRAKDELADVWRRLGPDREVRAVLVTGAGRAFCSGGDVKQMDPDRSPEATRAMIAKLGREVVIPLARLEKPVVAAVNGHAHGLGLALALACDLIYAAEGAVLSAAFTRIGLSPDGCCSYLLARAVGVLTAKDLMFTGRRVDGAEAKALGLVTRVLPDAELLPAAREAALGLAAGPTIALARTKRLLDDAAARTLEETAELEALAQAVARASDDHAEGVAAFAAKRRPEFTGS